RDEYRHLSAGVVVEGAVKRRRNGASAGDVLGGQLLDPVGELGGAGDIVEDAGAGGWGVAGSVARLQQKDRHLVTADRILRAVGAGAAAARDAAGGEVLDPVGEGGGAGHIGEV